MRVFLDKVEVSKKIDEPREAHWLRQSLAIAFKRGNSSSIFSGGWERFQRVGGVQLHLTTHIVPEGISSSMRDFIILVFILKFLMFSCLFF